MASNRYNQLILTTYIPSVQELTISSRDGNGEVDELTLEAIKHHVQVALTTAMEKGYKYNSFKDILTSNLGSLNIKVDRNTDVNQITIVPKFNGNNPALSLTIKSEYYSPNGAQVEREAIPIWDNLGKVDGSQYEISQEKWKLKDIQHFRDVVASKIKI